MSQTFDPQAGMNEREKHLLNVFLSNGGNIWQNVTYENSWVDYNAAVPGRFAKDMWNRVWVEVAAKDGTITDATTVCTLPVGFRPARNRWYACVQTSAGLVPTVIGILLGTDGTVRIYGVSASNTIHVTFSFTLS